jgi:dihydroflavonol-4-reductase
VGDFAVHLSSYLQPKGVGSYLRTHVGRVPRYDTSKIEKELGVSFRPVEATILDTLDDLARHGHISRAPTAQDPWTPEGAAL